MPRFDLPERIKEDLVLEIYRKADELDWELLNNNQKTAQYRAWFEDPLVGGVLLRYNEERDIRVWLKDTLLKEYARAQEGIGINVKYVPRRFKGPQEVVSAALGSTWHYIPDTVEIKPNQCHATDDRDRRLVIWGTKAGVRDLFWAALTASVTSGGETVIVVTTRDGQAVTSADKLKHKAIGRRCDFEVVHLHRELLVNPDYIGSS